MTYENLAQFAQTWGIFYFIVIFLGVVIYAMWPRNRKRFEEAAKVPLRED